MTTKQIKNYNGFLIKVTMSCWTATSLMDNDEKKKIISGVNEKFVTGIKTLIKHEKLNEIKRIQARLRNTLRHYSLPFVFEGVLFIPNIYKEHVYDLIKTTQHEIKECVDQLIKIYPTLIKNAEIALGVTFNMNDYPPADMLHTKFGVTASQPFDIISHNEKNELVEQFLEESIPYLLEELKDIIEKFNKITGTEIDPITGERKHKKFSHKNFDELQRIVKFVKIMNITNNQQINVMLMQVENIISGFELNQKNNAAERLRTDINFRTALHDVFAAAKETIMAVTSSITPKIRLKQQESA